MVSGPRPHFRPTNSGLDSLKSPNKSDRGENGGIEEANLGSRFPSHDISFLLTIQRSAVIATNIVGPEHTPRTPHRRHPSSLPARRWIDLHGAYVYLVY
jgi:hypothetical protein